MKWNVVYYWSSPVSMRISCPDPLVQKNLQEFHKIYCQFQVWSSTRSRYLSLCHLSYQSSRRATCCMPLPDWQLLPVGAICSRVFVLTRWGLWWRERSVLSPVKLPLNTANLLLTLPPWDVIQVRTFAWRTWLWVLLHSYVKLILLRTWQAIKQNTQCQITA